MSNAALFNLNDLTAADTATIEILHPVTKDPIGIKITVYGSDSEHHKALERKRLNSRMNNILKKGKVSASQTQEENLSLLVEDTADWSGVALDGEELPCTPENVRMLYTRFAFIKEQVDEAISDRSLFIKS